MAAAVEGRVRDMAGADGVLETERGIVFVPAVVPGDLVRIARVRKRGKVLRGEGIELLEASPERRDPPCAIIDRCGGCPWMQISDTRQVELKRSRLKSLERPDVRVEWHQSSTLGYRQRARLAWRGKAMGYRERRAKQVVDAPTCLVLDDARAEAWARLRTLAGVLAGEGEILLGPADEGAVALLRTRSAQNSELYERCPTLVGDVLRGIVLEVDGARAEWGETLEAYLVDGGRLVSPVGGFAQGHGALNDALVQYVGSRVPKGRCILELHCGAGNLSVRLARDAESWTGVELDPEAVQACRGNLKARGIRGKVVQASAETFPRGRFDVVVLDPPRSGARDAVERIAGTRAERVVYVSCHLATLERDVKILRAAGYRLDAYAAFDMFPQTPHLEVVATLKRES